MKLNDIISLAKSGFTVSDIKELMALDVVDDTEELQEENETIETDESRKKEESQKNEEDSKSSDDYIKEIDELKKQISALQEKNITGSVEDTNKPTADSIIDDLLK